MRHLKIKAGNERGVALIVVVVVVLMLTAIAGYMMQLGFNQRKLTQIAGGQRAKTYFRAQAAIVEANWRIRTDYTAGLAPGGVAPFNFANDLYDPGSKDIDVDGNGTMDARFDIGPANPVTKVREILATGLDA